ncbi:MAG: hypothetical protein FJ221_11815 [Lentisphaerae bacterium]|nr:hypothetical protein [Lentisphaerota bacterium]
MSQSFRCGKCGTLLEAGTCDIGQPVECPECHFAFEVPRRRLGPGVKLGGFTIESMLGRGGMGEVYLARQVSMDRQVALKVLPAHLTADPERVKRFLAEVRNSARLDHPNIVSAHEAGDDAGTYYLAMTFVRGESLERRLKREGPLPEAQALGIVRKVACALAYAWAQHRMLHRDIKPANVMVDASGEPRLLDMGLSKCLDDQASLTMSSAVMGTPNYMSPEQAEGKADLDFRTDLYSLGAMLYHMLTGELPFAGSSLMETLRKQVSEKLPDPRTRNAGISEAAVAVLERMLAKKKEKRHESWEALIAEIDRVLAGRKPEAKPLDAGDSMMLIARDGRTLPMAPASPHRQGGKLVVHVKGGRAVGQEDAASPAPAVKTPAAETPKLAQSPKIQTKKKPAALLAAAAVVAIAIPALWFALRDRPTPLASPPSTPHPPPSLPAPRPSSDTFTREIAALSPGDQVIRVAKKLKELNPGYDGRIGYKSESAMLKIADPAATNLVPLQALPWLKELVCDPAALAAPSTADALRPLPALATINGVPAAEVWKKLATAGPSSAVDEAFVREVAALPREEQVRRVAAKLKELNPQFDGQVTSSDLDDQSRAGIQFSGSGVSTIAPVRALAWLASLHIKSTKKPSELTDLSPLRGLKLRGLILSYTCVSDLSPLRDMPLETAAFYNSPIVDLSPLTGSPLDTLRLVFTRVRNLDSLRTLRLTSLTLDGSPVTDLTPLRGMPLKLLNIHGTLVPDLGPLAGMPLTSLYCGSTPVNDLSPLRNLPLRSLEVWPDQVAPPANAALLRSMKTLETINGLPAAEFWKLADAGKLPEVRAAVAESAEEAGGAAPAAALKQPGSVFTNAVGAEMVAIPPGEFMLGSTKEEQAWARANGEEHQDAGQEGEHPRKTTIKQGFWMGRTEVTVGQWKQFVAATGYVTRHEKAGGAYSYDQGKRAWGDVKGASWKDPKFGLKIEDHHPVVVINWNGAVAFCEWLNEQEQKAGRVPPGFKVRLPTEAEWEYACRAGTQTKFWWGEAKEDGGNRVNWFGKGDGFEFFSPADSYGARGRNNFGLADMLGNVWELCLDEFDVTQAHGECYRGNPDARVIRGGAFYPSNVRFRSASRASFPPSSASSLSGFRVCLGPDVANTGGAGPASADVAWSDAIDLLPLVDPAKDAVAGTWALENGGLKGESTGGSPRVEIPYQPPAEYDFRIVFARQKGAGVAYQMLTGGGRPFAFCIAAQGPGLPPPKYLGFAKINGKDVNENPTAVRLDPDLEAGRHYTALVQVRKDRVMAFLDGRLVSEWKTDYQDMSIHNSIRLRDDRSLGLGSSPAGGVVFYSAEVREVTGKGTFTRGAPASSALPVTSHESRITSPGDWTTLPNGWRVGKPVNLGPGVNGAANDSNLTVSGDGLTLLFMSTRPGSRANNGIWFSTRPSTQASWGAPQYLDDAINKSTQMWDPCLSSDGLKLIFATGRPDGHGNNDLWMSTPNSREEPWGKPENLGPVINTENSEVQPFITADGLTLLFKSDRPGGLGSLDIWMSTRPTIGAPWSKPINLGPPVNSEWEDGRACLTSDGLTLFFASTRGGAKVKREIWMSTRRSKAEPFGEPVNMGPTINTQYEEVAPWLSADDRTLHFHSDRPGGQGGHDLWQVPVLPPDASASTPTLQSSTTPAVDAAFCAEVAVLPAEQQVARVVAELKRLNPGFDPKTVKHEISGNHDVAAFAFSSAGVTNLSAVRALARLYRLDCSGPKEGRRSPLQDLSPLRGLRLKHFYFQYTEVADLSPLVGMPLESLACFNTRVKDLAPLQGMPLKGLNCMSTEVGDLAPLASTRQLEALVLHGNRGARDLTPLRGLPLKSLTISGTSVSDMSPLDGMPLERIECDPPVIAHPANEKVLRSIKTLKTINQLPAEEFWKQVDAGMAPAAR